MDGVTNKPDAVYANFVAASNSAYEMRLEFFVESPEQENRLKEVADIRMSPQMAKQLREILTQVVDAYEKNIGKIPVPEEKQASE